MSSEQLQRTTYRDPVSGDIRTDESSPTESESARDMDDYYLPLARVHGSGLHGWGVASGLSVTVTLADPTTGTLPALNVSPGIALDSAGQHISLALGGEAETTTDLDTNGNPATSVPAEVTTSGAFILPTSVLPSSVLPGIFSLTIQFWEWFEGDIDPTSPEFYKYVHFPWLRLLATPPTDGSVVVLATVTLDASGNITALTRDPGLGVFLPAESIKLSRAINNAGPNFSVNNTLSGTISSHPAGGILLRGQNAGDDIHFVRNDGSESITVEADFGTLAVGAAGVPGMIAVSDWTAPAIFLSGDEATIRVGRASNYGEVDVYDGSDNLAVASNGAEALITVGGTNNPGVIRTFDAGRNTTVRIEAATGVARLMRLAAIAPAPASLPPPPPHNPGIIDVDAFAFKIHGEQLVLDGNSMNNNIALFDAGDQLIVNNNNNYSNGVFINNLHLADHITAISWESLGVYDPGINQWNTFYNHDTGLLASDWAVASICQVGMEAYGHPDGTLWVTQNSSTVSASGTIVVQWQIWYSYYVPNDGPYRPISLAVFWIAIRQ